MSRETRGPRDSGVWPRPELAGLACARSISDPAPVRRRRPPRRASTPALRVQLLADEARRLTDYELDLLILQLGRLHRDREAGRAQ